MASSLPNIMELAQLGIYVVGAYEGYIYITKGQSVIPNDPIQKAIVDLMNSIYPPPPTSCPTGQHLSNGVCVLDGTPPPTTCNVGYHLENGACVADTTNPPPTGDIYAPIVLIANPPTATLTMGPGAITIAGSAVDYTGGTGLKQVRVRVNVDAWVVATPSIAGDFTRWSIPITFNTAGFYAVHVEATDNSNNAVYLTIPITVTAGGPAAPTPPANIPLPTMPSSPPVITPPPSGDAIPPTVRIDSPIVNASVTIGNVNVSGVASDNAGVAAVDIRLDNGPWLPCNGTTVWNAVVPVTVTGTHVLQARATDTAGNMQWYDSAIVATTSTTPPPTACPAGQHLAGGICVPDVTTCPTGQHLANGVCVPNTTGDTTLPVVAITSPTSGASLASNVMTISGIASDVGSGIAGVYVRITNHPALGTPWMAATVTGGTWSINFDAFTSGDFTGPYIFEARADDNAGNMQWSTPITINYAPSTPPPTLNPVVTLNKPNYLRAEVITVTGTGFAPNEVVGCRFTIEGVLQNAHDATCNAAGGFTTTFTTTNVLGGGHITCTGRTSNAVGQSPGFNVVVSGAYGRAYTGRVARTRLGQEYQGNPYEQMAIAYR